MTRVGSTFVSGERSPPELIGWPASEHGWLGVSVLRLNGTISSRYLAPLQRPVCDLNPCELRRCAMDNHWPVDINPLRPWAMNPISLRHHHIFTEPSGRAPPRSQPVTVQVDPPEPMRCKRNETSSASIPSTNTVK